MNDLSILEIHEEYIKMLNAIYYFAKRSNNAPPVYYNTRYREDKKRFNYYVTAPSIPSPFDVKLEFINEAYTKIVNYKLKTEEISISEVPQLKTFGMIDEKSFLEVFPTARERVLIKSWFKDKVKQRKIKIDLDNLL